MKLFNRYTVAAFIAGAGLVAGIGAVAQGAGLSTMHQGMMNADASPADVAAHVDHMLKHLYVEIDATPAQQAQIGPLVQQAVTDLLPLRPQFQAGHTLPSLDRRKRRTRVSPFRSRVSQAYRPPERAAIERFEG